MKNINDTEKSQSHLTETFNKIGPYLGIGIGLATIILIFIFAGFWLDRGASTLPIFTIIGSFIGLSAGFYYFVKAMKELTSKRGKEDI